MNLSIKLANAILLLGKNLKDTTNLIGSLEHTVVTIQVVKIQEHQM